MRILHVITSLRTGGAEKLMVDLLPRFKAMGNEVELLLFDGTRTPFYVELENLGIKIHHLSICGNVYNPANIFKVRRYLSGYDIIHTHNTACQYYVSVASRMGKKRYKLVTTEHNTTNRRRNFKLFKLTDRAIYSAYDKIVAIAKSTADNLTAFIGSSRDIAVVDNGIDILKYSTSKTSQIPCADTDVIVTMIAGFRAQKNQDTLIRAMKLLPENVKLQLVGDGDRRKLMENLVGELNLCDRVEFTGVRTDIPEIMEQSHIIVLSSHWEGFGLSSVEGCASGRPVVASDVPGLREVIGDAGILFPDNDHAALAEEIMKLITDGDHYQAVAARCRQRAMDYDINITANKYISLYKSLLE